MSQVLFDYTKQDASGASCTAHAWAKVPEPLNPQQRTDWKARAAALLEKHNAVLVAHYYVDGDLQDLALETGGCVADSLEMARFGRDHAAKTLVVAGVRFMGETAKILSPEKRVLMPDLDATCSLDLGCPPDEPAPLIDPRLVSHTLAQVLAIDGLLGCALIDSESGQVLAREVREDQPLDIAVAAHDCAPLVRAHREAARRMGLPDAVDEIVVTGRTHQQILRALHHHPALFVLVLLDRQRANQALARFKLADAVKNLV